MEILLLCFVLNVTDSGGIVLGGCSVKQMQFMKNTVLWDVLPCCLASHPLRQYGSVITLRTSDMSHSITVVHLVVYLFQNNTVYAFSFQYILYFRFIGILACW